jgi:hypothetical protein
MSLISSKTAMKDEDMDNNATILHEGQNSLVTSGDAKTSLDATRVPSIS